jgi:hypothetical protein
MVVTQSTKKVLMFLLIILLVFLTFGFSEKLAVLPELNRPSFIQIDSHKLYVLDNVEVKTYAMKDYRFLGKFGKPGNGPGELVPNEEIPLQMQLKDGEVFLNSQTKWIRFSTSGQVIKEKVTHFMGMQIIPLKLGKTYVISKTGFDESAQIFFRVILYDKDLKELKTIYTSERSPTLRGTGKIILPPNYTYMYCAGGRLFVTSGRQEKFHIKVFDLDGNPLKAITLDYKRLKWTESFKKEVMDWLAKLPRVRGIPEIQEILKQKLVFLEYMPAIRNVVAADNKIYVQTYKKKNNLSEFFVFDFNGKLLKTVFLPGTSGYKVKLNPDIPFTIKNNKYYHLVEDEKGEEWELHVSKIE